MKFLKNVVTIIIISEKIKFTLMLKKKSKFKWLKHTNFVL